MATTEQQSPARSRLGYIILFVLGLLVFLALLSYDPGDSDFLAGGLGGDMVINNWIGFFGAGVSRFLLLLFGFAAYLGSTLLVVASGRRLFGRRGLRPPLWDYWTAFGLVTVGVAMFCGIWPQMAADTAGGLNLGGIPGGVIGQRFCAPDGGWMRIILNPTGSAIVSFALAAVGLTVLWVYDWHDLFRDALAARADKRAVAQDDKPKRRKPGIVARREARLREQALLEEGMRSAGKDAPTAAVTRKNVVSKPDTKADGAPAEQEPPAIESSPARSTTAREYVLPGLDLLNPSTAADSVNGDPEEIAAKKEILQETLESFGIDAEVGEATSGPRVTLFEVLPAPGVKVERISQITNNIAMELRATSLRILTPIPGKKSVGIEVPNTTASMVSLASLMASSEWQKSNARIPVLLGRNISGKVVVLDLTRAPHLLIAGATGSGKSVCINALIMSMLYRFTPDDLRLIMIDPKVVEFRPYEALPHLVVPVISDVKKVHLALRWVINEMQHRYQIIAKVGARNVDAYNSRTKNKRGLVDDAGVPLPEKLPHIVVIIDELADIIMTARADVETSLARIAQLSRAVGIHSIIATQRPSVNVITGTIKANFPTRIAFQVTSQVDSRTILDVKGADSLLGRGDMLFKPPGASRLERNQGAMVEDEEIERVVAHCAAQAAQDFDERVFRTASGPAGDGEAGAPGEPSEADEELIQNAIEIIVRDRRATTSYLQRCLRIGYNRAASIIEILEQRGVVGPQVGTTPREILIVGDGSSGPEDDEDDKDDDGAGEP